MAQRLRAVLDSLDRLLARELDDPAERALAVREVAVARSVVADAMAANGGGRAAGPGELADAQATIGRLLEAIDDHLYTGVLSDDGSYTEVFTGPNLERLLGIEPGALPAGDLIAAYSAAIHPADRARVDAFNDRLGTGEAAELQYRLVGLDGVTRWVLDKARPRPRTGDVVLYDGIVSDVTARVRSEAEQAALGRVATAVASGAEPEHVFRQVSEEIACLLEVETGHVARFDGTHYEFVGRSDSVLSGTPLRMPLTGWSAAAAVHRTGRSARVRFADHRGDEVADRLYATGYRASIAAPVLVGGALWGVIVAATTSEAPIASDGETRLERLAHLVGLAIMNADARSRLAEQAARDPLTSLPNHRTFQERLRDETERALRHERPLSLVLVDLDWFKQVNDAHGHPVGDQVLVEVAGLLESYARAGELVARMGGEEFGWILPETDAAGALEAAERVRGALASHPFPHGIRLTISAGVCDLTQGGGAAELVRLADGALYWAKAQGRNACVRYTPSVVEAVSAAEHAEARSRVQAMNGIRALARAVDAKDHSTREHSERVAALAEALALTLGWSAESAAALRVAGLVHDVGKIGIPDAILTKPARLTAEEYEAIKAHAPLGASIVSDVLTREQTQWVRHHHERWDGRGYPDRLAGVWIPEGARILALADAWDVMTSVRPYKLPMGNEDALADCRAQAGKQFCPTVVDALERLLAARASAAA